MPTRPDRARCVLPPPGDGVGHKPTVLFVCIHNAGRSVAARLLLEHYANGWVIARSAGSQPAAIVNPAIVEVLRERGLDPSAEKPKRLDDEDLRSVDVVVTMGCGDACPHVPGVHRLDWSLTDPAGRTVDEVRAIVDEIDQMVQELLAAVLRARAAPARLS